MNDALELPQFPLPPPLLSQQYSSSFLPQFYRTVPPPISHSSVLMNNNKSDKDIKIAKKQVYIKNADISTTEEDILKYVKKKFDCEDVNCNQIVPWNIRRADLSFCNFKLSLPEIFFKPMMEARNWPYGCKVREFKTSLKATTDYHPQNFQRFRRNSARS